MKRYFVTVYARSADDLRRLQQHSLDLFSQTAKRARSRVPYPMSIEGLLTTEQAETLVNDGYRVTLEEPVEARSHAAANTVEFSAWLEQMQPALVTDKAVRQ